MNNDNFNKNSGKSKGEKIFGWIFLIAGIIVFLTTIGSYFSWQLKKVDYVQEYVYSNYGNLYYELDGNRKYVQKIYNTDGEIIELDIPDKKTIIMYCDKNNMDECIYFDTDNSMDQSMQNPIMGIFSSLFLVSFAIFLLYEKRLNRIGDKRIMEQDSFFMSRIYILHVFFFVVGVSIIIWQLYNASNYFSLKNNDNTVKATIYSEIYNIDKDKDVYKPVLYYYVDNQKYIYVNDSYMYGTLEENLGKMFELYYDKANPSKALKKENPVDFLILLIGICFSGVSFPFVFFKEKMARKIGKNLH